MVGTCGAIEYDPLLYRFGVGSMEPQVRVPAWFICPPRPDFIANSLSYELIFMLLEDEEPEHYAPSAQNKQPTKESMIIDSGVTSHLQQQNGLTHTQIYDSCCSHLNWQWYLHHG
jgi:hypothetical protein